MAKPYKVVHFLNQFFAGIGGEEQANTPVQASDGPIGPGREGANTALPIWIEVMRAASEGLEPKDFEIPVGVVLRTIDARTGLLSSDACGASVVVAFMEGSAPTRACGVEEARILTMSPYQQAYFINDIRDGGR